MSIIADIVEAKTRRPQWKIGRRKRSSFANQSAIAAKTDLSQNRLERWAGAGYIVDELACADRITR
jgi:hypothetical protein